MKHGMRTSASMAAGAGFAAQDVPYPILRKRLDADGQVCVYGRR